MYCNCSTGGKCTCTNCKCTNCKCSHGHCMKPHLKGSRKDLIKYWVHHLVYTRLVVMSVLSNDNNTETMLNRLLQNQKDIGSVFTKVYNSQVGLDITKELTIHIVIAGKVLKALKSNNKQNLDTCVKEFYNNAQVIGTYLDDLFHSSCFVEHMKHHIDSLIKDVLSYNSKDYKNDIKDLDDYINAGLDMAFDMAKKLN